MAYLETTTTSWVTLGDKRRLGVKKMKNEKAID